MVLSLADTGFTIAQSVSTLGVFRMATSRTAPRRRFLPAFLTIALIVPLAFSLGSARAAPTELFFSEYIEGTSNNKALEIFNGTGAPVDLAANGYAIQMFFNGNPAAGLTIGLTGTVASGDVYVVAQSAASPVILAQADQTNGSGWFNGDDAVVLLKGATVIDSIGQRGVDPGTEWGTGLTSTADNTLRRKAAIEAGDPNPNDVFDPAVQWDGFATDTFDGLGAHTIVVGDQAPAVASTTPANDATEVVLDANVTVTFTEPVSVTGSWFTISCTTSGQHSAVASGGPTTFTLDPDSDFASGEACTVSIASSQVADLDTDDPPDLMAADFAFGFTTPVEIHDLQGASHLSPLAGRLVSGVAGIVTARLGNGFYLQDPTPDADHATSDAVFVFTSSAPTVAVGDALIVAGRVAEFRPGGAASTNLTTTEIVSPVIIVLSNGNPLPAATVLGAGARTPPTTVIEDDAAGSVETSGVFDPAQDGIDFYESLEAMRVQVNDALAVGPTSQFGEIPVVGDASAAAGIDTVRGGVVISPGDFNPERIILDDTILPTPVLNVADGFTTAVVGVLDYSFSNFKLNVTAPLTRIDRGLEREETRAPADYEIVVGTYNVENLDPSDGRRVRPPCRPDRAQPPGARSDCRRGDPGQRWSDRQRHDGRLHLLEHAHRGDPGGRRPRVRVPPDRPGQQRGRRPAWWEHPGRLPLQDGPRARVRGSPGRGLDDRDLRGLPALRPPTLAQPRARRPGGRCLGSNSQASRRRVPDARQEGVRDREPLQLEGRRRAALRALPATDPGDGDGTPRPGPGRERLRRPDPRASIQPRT